MEIKLLEDFVALAKFNNFSEAAKARFLTQPAFSRRIRSLEAWLDVKLINRDLQPIQLTSTGEKFLPKAKKLVNTMYRYRDDLQNFSQGRNSITVHTQHSLMISHVSELLENMQSMINTCFIRFASENQQEAVDNFLAHENDLLLSFAGLGIPQRLSGSHIESISVSSERMLPVTAVNEKGKPIHKFPSDKSLCMLTYPRGSFFQRIIEQHSSQVPESNHPVHPVFENVLATGLKLMTLKGYGVAWLPECLIEKELADKTLVLMEGDGFLPIELKVNLYRHKSSTVAAGQTFWKYFS